MKEKLSQLKQQEKQIQIEIGTLVRKCKHFYVNKYDAAVCEICEDRAGWYCPTAPERTCVYGETDYSCENCLYCGQPDERK